MHKLNLIPKDIQVAKTKKKKMFLCSIVFCIVIVTILYSFTYIDRKVKELSIKIQETSEELEYFNLDINKLNDFEQRQKIYDALNLQRFSWSIIVNQIMALKPDEVTINCITGDEEQNIILKGTSLKNSYIAQFMDNLATIKEVSDIKLNYIERKQSAVNLEDVYSFEILSISVKRIDIIESQSK